MKKRDRLKYERSYSLGWRDARNGRSLNSSRVLTPDRRYPDYCFVADIYKRYDQGWNNYHAHRARLEAGKADDVH